MEQLQSDLILNSLADGVYVTDPDRRILFWNHAAEKITGWKREQIIGRSCSDNILVHVDKDGHALCGEEHCPLHRCIVTRQSSVLPLIVFAQRQNGERLPVQVSVSPILNRRGEVIGGVEVFRDLRHVMEDLDRARIIQGHAMDTALPKDPRIQFTHHSAPLEFVGGDFHRMEQIDADRYAILLADVMGHGVASALYTMYLRSLWEESRTKLLEPASLLSRFNRKLCVLTQGDYSFATAVYGVIDLREGTFRFSGAGHPSPLLFRANDSVEPLDAKGVPLGMVESMGYETLSVRLYPGDRLLFYTDAAVDLHNRNGEILDEEGFRRLLKNRKVECSPECLAQIEKDLLLYSDDIRLTDDLTLMVIQIN